MDIAVYSADTFRTHRTLTLLTDSCDMIVPFAQGVREYSCVEYGLNKNEYVQTQTYRETYSQS
jgi:hypothetical protein